MMPTRSTEEPFPALVGQIDSPVQLGLPFALRLPSNLLPHWDILAGRYFLARCSDAVGVERDSDWSIFLRCPLFVCGRQPRAQYDRWQLYLPTGTEGFARGFPGFKKGQSSGVDIGFRWLAQRPLQGLLNLLGPFGNGFTLQALAHNLLILVDYANDPAWFWRLFSLCERALDRGGRVTILLRSTSEKEIADLIPLLPVQVEVCTATNEMDWQAQLLLTVGWADRICAGIPASRYRELLGAVQETRFHVDKNFAQVLVRTDLLCGVGACLVCAIPTARGGVTRACVHGPVFDLIALVD